LILIDGSRRIHGQAFARTISSDGSVTVDDVRYVSHKLAGQKINLVVHTPDKVLDLFQGVTHLKSMPIKGLYGKLLPFEEYATLMRHEARSDGHRPTLGYLRLHQASLWA